jgi:UDP-N-acetyl-D-glucosamine dehydrogenase
MKSLKTKIKNNKATIAIIGAGYVGLPLGVLFASSKLKVNIFDVDKKRIGLLNKGKSYIEDVSSTDLKKCLSKNLKATSSPEILSDSDIIIICVPTPLSKTGKPDVSFIRKSVSTIKKHLRKSQLVILESTTYPGTTREIVLSELEKSGLKIDKDFYLAFSSERVDPLNKKYKLKSIPKVVGGVTVKSTQIAAILYKKAFEQVVSVSSSEVAEMSKLLENTFRSVNIGLINQINKMCNVLKIDVWDVIKAAKTKPFGFMPFYPGPGLGGHCLPTDPKFLSWKAKVAGYRAYNMIDLAHQINHSMPKYIINKLNLILKSKKKKIKDTKTLIIGVSYKKDIGDIRESPALDIIASLQKKHAKVDYYDPHVQFIINGKNKIKSLKTLNKNIIKKYDCIVIVTDHSKINYRLIAREAKLIFDTRNALRNIKNKKDNVIKL